VFAVSRGLEPSRIGPIPMRLGSLKHMADVIRSMARSEKIVVMGSASLFASFPELDRENGPLQATYDADVILFPFEELEGQMVHDALGQGRTFHQIYGYYADILRPLAAEEFTPGWEDRLVPLSGFEGGVFCLDPYDMAVCKLRAGRPKDIALLVHLLKTGLMNRADLKARLDATPMREAVVVTTYRCFHEVVALAEKA
jgi:hypothetical protein